MITKAAKRTTSPQYPQAWAKLSQGERVKRELESALAPIVERVFGYYLVKLGNLSSALELPTCPIKQKLNFAQYEADDVHMFGKSCQLPLQNKSVDAFVVLAELDFAMDPHQIVREIDRTITSDGHVIIAGFNPFSLAGIVKYLPINRGNMLHHGRFFTAGRIKDWLQLLDFEIVQHEHLVYSSLFTDDGIMGKYKTLNTINQRLLQWYKTYLPWFSSMYIIVAKKTEVPMSVVRPKWKIQPKFNTRPATAAVSGRSASSCKRNPRA